MMKKRMERKKAFMLVKSVVDSYEGEFLCDDCVEFMEQYAEAVLEKRDLSEQEDLVRDHLDKCMDCREIFDTLVVALQAVENR